MVHTLVYWEGETDVGMICEEVIDTALELDSRDNMTCCVVIFPPCVKSGSLTTGSSLRGVMKRRLSREQTWGAKLTPAKCAQQRFEECRNKHQELVLSQIPQSTWICLEQVLFNGSMFVQGLIPRDLRHVPLRKCKK